MAKVTPYGGGKAKAEELSGLQSLADKARYPKNADMIRGLLSVGLLPIGYYIERRTKHGLEKILPLPNQPSSVTINKVYTENPIYTFDPTFSFRQIAPPRVAEVTINGFTGSKGRLGINEEGLLEYMDGQEHMRSFDRFLNEYFKDAAAETVPATYDLRRVGNDLNYEGRPYLIFRAIDEGVHGRCTIQNFTYMRSADKARIGYQWQLTLRVYDSTSVEFSNPIQDFMDDLEELLNIGATYTSALVAAVGIGTQVLESARGPLGAVKDLQSGIGDLLDSPVSIVNAFGETWREITDIFTTGALNRMSPDRWFQDNTFNSADTAGEFFNVSSWEDQVRNRAAREQAPAEGLVNEGQTTDPRLSEDSQALSVADEDAIYLTIDLMYYAMILKGYTGAYLNDYVSDALAPPNGEFLSRDSSLRDLAAFHGAELKAGTSFEGVYQKYTLRAGETLTSVALGLFGDPEQWHVLAALNGCQDALTMADGSPVGTGTEILIPIQSGGLLAIPNAPGLTTLDQITGTDIAVDLSGDIRFRDGDLDMVSEAENLMQWIINTLRTVTGDIPYARLIGMPATVIGMKLTDEAIAFAVALMREALLVDPRIVNVNAINLVRSGDSINVRLNIDCINDISFDFTTPLVEEL